MGASSHLCLPIHFHEKQIYRWNRATNVTEFILKCKSFQCNKIGWSRFSFFGGNSFRFLDATVQRLPINEPENTQLREILLYYSWHTIRLVWTWTKQIKLLFILFMYSSAPKSILWMNKCERLYCLSAHMTILVLYPYLCVIYNRYL